MALHDAYLRRTPFELAFPDPDAADEFTSAVAGAGEAAGVDLVDRQAFVTLDVVGSFLRRMQPAGNHRVGPETTYDHALLLYHMFHFARAGAAPILVSEAAARRLVAGAGPSSEAGASGAGATEADESRAGASGAGAVGEIDTSSVEVETTSAPSSSARVEAPAQAGYAQLPRNLFWIQSTPNEPAEAVDGFFWCLGGGGMLHVLLAAGMRDDRPGLAVVPVPEAPWGDARTWLDAPIRPDGRDFATTLPGGELEELYSFTAAGEVLKLVARLFARVQAHPERLVRVRREPSGDSGPADPPAGPPGSGPIPSVLPYQRI